MKYVAVYINCLTGKFRVYGLFDSEEDALHWIDCQNDPAAYSAFLVEGTSL
jgi:hypothetical protein